MHLYSHNDLKILKCALLFIIAMLHNAVNILSNVFGYLYVTWNYLQLPQKITTKARYIILFHTDVHVLTYKMKGAMS